MCVCAQSYLTLCSSINCSPPGSFVRESLQARTLEWVASPLQKILSKGSSQSRDRTHISQVSALAGSILYHRAIWESQTSLRGSKSNRFFLVPVVLIPSRDHWKVGGLLHISILIRASVPFILPISIVGLFK